MSILKTMNSARRAVMRRITRDLGKTRLRTNGAMTGPDKIARVLICRPNHRLGNLLMVTPLLQEVGEALPHAKIDLFVKGSIAPILFRNYGNIGRIIQLPKKPLKKILQYIGGWFLIKRTRYDLVINVVNHSSSGKISAQFANAAHRFLGDIDNDIRLRYPDHEHMAKYPVYSFRNHIRQLGVSVGERSVPPLSLKLSTEEIAEGKEILADLVKNNNPTIAIYTFATGAKCYDKSWWEEFYERLRNRFPQYNIVEVLPIENVSQISFRAPSFYSRELREIGSLVANTEIFIGADSGMMHLASAAQTPVVGLFKAENMSTYAPYNNGSVGVNTDETDIDALTGIVETILVDRSDVA